MKKLIALLLAIGMVVSLGACKKPADNPSGITEQNAKATESTKADTPTEITGKPDTPTETVDKPDAPTEVTDKTDANTESDGSPDVPDNEAHHENTTDYIPETDAPNNESAVQDEEAQNPPLDPNIAAILNEFATREEEWIETYNETWYK